MKVRSDLMLREIAGENILVPVGEAAAAFQGIISLNGSGLLLWRRLQAGAAESELVDALLAEYDASPETARQDVTAFVEQLRQHGLLAEE